MASIARPDPEPMPSHDPRDPVFLEPDARRPDPPAPTPESILAAKRAQVKERFEFEHARRWPDGCEIMCEKCLIRVKLPEAWDMLTHRTLRLPTIDHLRALDLHYRILSGEVRS